MDVVQAGCGYHRCARSCYRSCLWNNHHIRELRLLRREHKLFRECSQTLSLTSIAITPSNPTISAGNTQQFTATGTYSNNTTSVITNSVTWTSSDNTIATINSSGLASGVSAGDATVVATSGSVSGSTTLTVQ